MPPAGPGVDDVRRDPSRRRAYRPIQARTKVFVIDEVHMLSRNAFNALLKTLEEPPPHVKFVFATTELRKVPVTVLSRCQRFDLQRVRFRGVGDPLRPYRGPEGVTVQPAALDLITRAADGSVRDGLSLLDQAIAQADGDISAAAVVDMLGLADRGSGVRPLDAVMFPASRARPWRSPTSHMNAAPISACCWPDLLELIHMRHPAEVGAGAARLARNYPRRSASAVGALADRLSVPVWHAPGRCC